MQSNLLILPVQHQGTKKAVLAVLNADHFVTVSPEGEATLITLVNGMSVTVLKPIHEVINGYPKPEAVKS